MQEINELSVLKQKPSLTVKIGYMLPATKYTEMVSYT